MLNNFRTVIIIIILIISIFINFIDSPTINYENDDIGDSQEPLSDNQQMTPEIRGASCRGIWIDTFDIESRIESKENVVLSNGDVILSPQQKFLFTSTSDFNNGTKDNIATNSDWKDIPENEFQLLKDPLFIDRFEGVDNQDLDVYDPNWIVDITDGSTIKIDTSHKYSGSSCVKWSANDNIFTGASIAERSVQDFADVEFILYFRVNVINQNTDQFIINTFDENGNSYVVFVFGGSGNLWELRYYDGITLVKSGKEYAQNIWYKIKITHNTTVGSWNAWIDGGAYNNYQIVNNATRYDLGTEKITKFLLKRNNAWDLHHSEFRIDDIFFGDPSSYKTMGSWQTSEIDLPPFFKLKDTTISFSELAPDKAEIDKIDWLVDDEVKASYENDIKDSSLTPLTIKDTDLTFGTYKNIDSSFTIKIHLSGDGTRTPVIEQIEGDLVPIIGNITSSPITLYQTEFWDKLTMNKTTTETSFINLTILDAETDQAIPQYEDLSEANIDLTNINPSDHLSIKLHAEFISDGEFFPILHDWSVTWQPDYPRLIKNIPNDNSFDEDTIAGHLIDLGLYFDDKYDTIEDLIFTIEYESDPSHVHAYLDGYYLNFSTPTANWSGIESFIIECEDTSGLTALSNEFEVMVNPINDPPVWNITTTELHMDEDEKKLDWFDLNNLVYDVENDQLEFKLISQTNIKNIDVSIDTLNMLDVLPSEDYVGNSTFTIQVYEELNIDMFDEMTFTVYINPINDPPVLNDIGTHNVIEDQWLNFTLTSTDPDEGDELSYNCNLTKLPNFKINSTTGEVSFLPVNKDVGIIWVNFSVQDSMNVYDFENVNIKVDNSNDPPDLPIILAPEDNNEFITNDQIEFLAEEATDMDIGDELTYSWDFDASDGIQQDATGKLVTHSYPTSGSYTITLTISDGEVGVDKEINIKIAPPKAEKTEEKDQDWLAENWWIFIVILIIIIILAFGLIVTNKRKKDRSLANNIDGIDDIYKSFKSDPEKCENELERIRKMFIEDLKKNNINKEDFAILDRKIDEYIRKTHPGLPGGTLSIAQPLTLQPIQLQARAPTIAPPIPSPQKEPQPARVAKCFKCGEIIKIYTDEQTAIVKCPKCGEEGTV